LEISVGMYAGCGVLAVSTAIAFTLLKKSRLQKKQSDIKLEMFKKAFDFSEDAVLVLSNDNHILYANRALQKLLHLTEKDLENRLDSMPMVKVKQQWVSLETLLSGDKKSSNGKMQPLLQTSIRIEEDSFDIPVNLYIDHSSFLEADTKWCNIILIHDLRALKEKHELAHHHRLTKLPNQFQAKEDLNKLFSKIHLHNKKLAIALIDLDNFSQIYSILGYEQGEKIVIQFARYLERIAKASSFQAYHMYSNSFMVCMPVVESADEVVYFCRKIEKELKSFYHINEMRFHLTASIGIGIYPDCGSTRMLLDSTYRALFDAHKLGFGHICVYEKSEAERKYDDLTLFNAVHEAMEKKEFEVYYQPIVRSKDREVVAAEALVRWKHKEYGFVPPDVFIPILEKSGSIVELGRFMLTEVLKQQKRWELFKFKPIQISINMSLHEIESEGFVENVSKQLIEHQIDPSLIKFEITEGAAMQNETLADEQLQELLGLGVSLSLDDFGTGYTSFAYLKKFPAEILKIDKSMVDFILTKEEDQRIVKAMIELGHSLGMKIVVEGIENIEMVEMLASLGCDYMQGYYFGKPQPAFEFQELIRR